MDGTAGDVSTPIAGDRYSLQGVLGVGGMATVYRGYDNRLQIHRAIKVLAPALARRPKIRARFESEARLMALLNHPAIVRVLDVGIDTTDPTGERPFIVMELVDGGSLVDALEADGPFPPGDALDACEQVLEGLAFAHEQGVVHRDIKPHNILRDTDGHARITDFGIARLVERDTHDLTRTGAVMGTLGFMGPEQRLDAKSVGPTADIYAVGAMLYNLLTGKTPGELFAADLDPEMLGGIPAPVAALIRGATRYKPEDRFVSAQAMLAALRQARAELSGEPALPRVTEPSSASTIATIPPADPAPRRGTLATTIPEQRSLLSGLVVAAGVGGGVLMVGILGLGLAAAWWMTDQPTPPTVTTPAPLVPPAQPPVMTAEQPAPEPAPAEEEAAPTDPGATPVEARPTAAPVQASTAPSSPPRATPAPPATETPEPPKPELTTTHTAPAPAAVAGPHLQHTPVTSASDTLEVRARLLSAPQYDRVTLFYRPQGGSVWSHQIMSGSGTTYRAQVPLDDRFADGAEYFIEARSSEPGVAKIRSGSGFKPYRVRVTR